MKWTATALLMGVVVLFAGAVVGERVYPALSYVRAFAEAGIAGGLADWFAITALFRHPLSLPLPHTAIIPLNKDRIGENLGQFVERNFLSDEVIAAKLADVDVASPLLRWIAQPEQVEEIIDVAVAGISDFLDALDGEQAEDIERIASEAIAARLRKVELAPIVSVVVARLTQHIDYDAIIMSALQELALLFRDNRDVIRRRVHGETGWLWQRMSFDDKVADAVIRVIDGALEEVRGDPNHPWRLSFATLARDKLTSSGMSGDSLATWEALREHMLESEAFAESIEDMRRELSTSLRADAQSPGSVVRSRLREVIVRWTRRALADEGLQARMNERARVMLSRVVDSQRHDVGQLIADTVRRWDAGTVANKIETEVGRDLQFVRINGTLIGGLVGLALHALGALR